MASDKPGKILIAMFELSGGTTQALKYEDIVVKVFEMFPKHFALRGHPQYPDSSDVHKPLYGPLKRKGLVRAANKAFSLTQSGVQTAEGLSNATSLAVEQSQDARRLPRDVGLELKRVLDSEAVRLSLEDKRDKILDTDFYRFIGCTVRTPKNDFLGRLTLTDHAIEVATQLEHPNRERSKHVAELWEFLKSKFRQQIQHRQEGR
jgi:hypothetical protein